MELRHLRYFVAVAEELHFRRAAERLHVAQPAVSEQVRKLEEELGVRLLDRTHRSVSLTDAGAVMLTEARQVLRTAENAKLAARNARDRVTFRLRIGYVGAAMPASVPRALQRLAASSPRLEANFEAGCTFDLIDALRAERLDAAVVTLPAPVAGLRVTSLGYQHGVAALPVGHEQAVRTSIDLQQLAPDRVVVLPRDADRAFYDAVMASCHEAGLSPTIVELPSAHVEEALLAVASGAGLALLPESVADRYAAPGVRFVPLEGPRPTLEAAVVTRRDADHLPTAAFLRSLSRGPVSQSVPVAPPQPIARAV
jgi:DNA-binding transcriptional LysR family regulator